MRKKSFKNMLFVTFLSLCFSQIAFSKENITFSSAGKYIENLESSHNYFAVRGSGTNTENKILIIFQLNPSSGKMIAYVFNTPTSSWCTEETKVAFNINRAMIRLGLENLLASNLVALINSKKDNEVKMHTPSDLYSQLATSIENSKMTAETLGKLGINTFMKTAFQSDACTAQTENEFPSIK